MLYIYSYAGIWQLLALAEVLSVPISSIYPGVGDHTPYFNRILIPRSRKTKSANPIQILWTSTLHCNCRDEYWQPNHFVPVIKVTKHFTSGGWLYWFYWIITNSPILMIYCDTSGVIIQVNIRCTLFCFPEKWRYRFDKHR